jgi:hypothetical protein
VTNVQLRFPRSAALQLKSAVSQKASRLFAMLEILRCDAVFYGAVRCGRVFQYFFRSMVARVPRFHHKPRRSPSYLPAPLTYGYSERLQYLIFAFWGSSTGASFCSDMGSFCSHPLCETNDYRRPRHLAMIESCICSSAVFVLPAVTLML